MLPANEARSDLNNIRGQTGTVGRFGTFAGKALGMKSVRPAPAASPAPSAPGMASFHPRINTMTAGGGMVPPAPASPTPAPPAPTAIPGAPTPISNFGPGNDLLSSQINPGNSGVNRTQLAQNTLKDWDAQNAPQLAAGMRQVGQNAAKFGRIGAGMTTNDLTGLQATYDRNRMEKSNELASGLAGDTVNDARSNNNELRTERDYQTGRSDKAQQDQINQTVLGDQLLNSRFNRAKTLTDTGYANDPTSLLYGTSQDAGNQSANAINGGIDLLRKRQQPAASPDYTELLKQLIKQQGGG